MSECQFCKTSLVTDGVSSGQQIRCASCHAISRFGKIENVAADRLAWRSFWLGISSILLLMITGIPAMYYGIKSLLRMRFVKPKRSDQAAAMVGTMLGGCFGIFGGFIGLCALIIALISFLTSSETKDAAQVVQQCSQYFDFESPEVIPTKAVAKASTHVFEFANKDKLEDRSVAIRLIFLQNALQPNDAIMHRLLKSMKINKMKLGKHLGSEFLDWKMNSNDIEIRKAIFDRRPDDPDSNSNASPSPADTNSDGDFDAEIIRQGITRQYIGYQRYQNGLYGVAIAFEPVNADLTEADVSTLR